jgi:hypothetical protein
MSTSLIAKNLMARAYVHMYVHIRLLLFFGKKELIQRVTTSRLYRSSTVHVWVYSNVVVHLVVLVVGESKSSEYQVLVLVQYVVLEDSGLQKHQLLVPATVLQVA